jgi:hypothetical protein
VIAAELPWQGKWPLTDPTYINNFDYHLPRSRLSTILVQRYSFIVGQTDLKFVLELVCIIP